jgi:hypothetical protein
MTNMAKGHLWFGTSALDILHSYTVNRVKSVLNIYIENHIIIIII